MVSLFLANIWGWTLSHWRIVLIGFLVLFICVGLLFKSCGDSDSDLEKQADKSRHESITKEAETNVAVNKAEKTEQDVTNANNQVDNARRDAERSNRTDSSEFKGTDAGERFCDRFPNDSTCR